MPKLVRENSDNRNWRHGVRLCY